MSQFCSASIIYLKEYPFTIYNNFLDEVLSAVKFRIYLVNTNIAHEFVFYPHASKGC